MGPPLKSTRRSKSAAFVTHRQPRHGLIDYQTDSLSLSDRVHHTQCRHIHDTSYRGRRRQDMHRFCAT